jgi:hypothetical protein
MRLPPEDVELFYQLYYPLLCYVNRKLALIKGINSPEDFKKFPIKEINRLRERLYRQPDLIESFIEENPFNFSATELEIINSWTNFVKGTFVIFRCVKDYAIFLDTEEPPKAYEVLSLKSTFQEMVGPSLPVMVEAVLLPFNGRIIYDGVFLSYQSLLARVSAKVLMTLIRKLSRGLVSLPLFPSQRKK